MPSSGSSGKSQADSLRLSDPLRLVADMKKQHGITLKKSVIGQEIDPMAEHNQLLESDEEQDQTRETNVFDKDLKYIASLSNKEKKKLLKTLNKFEKSAKKKKRKKKSSRQSSNEEDHWSESEQTSHKKRQYSSSEEDTRMSYRKRKQPRNDGGYFRERRSRKDNYTSSRSTQIHQRDSTHSIRYHPTESSRRTRRSDDDSVGQMINQCRTSAR